MRILKHGDRGPLVRRWQNFLIGQGCDPKGADGKFGDNTAAATRAFQAKCKLPQTGRADNATLAQAGARGFELFADPADDSREGANFPPRPDFAPLVGTRARQRVFGRFAFVHEPKPDNRENIRITDDWARDNVERIALPQLAGVRGAPRSTKVWFHRKGTRQLRAMWQAWADAGLADRVLTWGGSYVPRFIRGSTTVLSNHAFGTAFDINVAWNGLGAVPALVGQKGCLRELVGIANDHGFYWGGHFRNRPDGMHFEVAEPWD